jgi:UDP-glucose 4-epimerase
VSDAVDATLLAARKTEKHSVFNVGSKETITAEEIGFLVVSLLGLEDVKYEFTGGRTGWLGDIPIMLLSIEKLKRLGWKPEYSIEKSIKDTINWLKTYFP